MISRFQRAWRGSAGALATVGCAAACTIAARPAAAQTTEPQGEALVLVSSSTTTTTIVGGVILTVVLAGKNAGLEHYLRDNAVALRQEISQGGGDTIADLADVFSIELDARARFATMLRRSRDELLPLLEAVDAEAARRFVEIVSANARRAGLLG